MRSPNPRRVRHIIASDPRVLNQLNEELVSQMQTASVEEISLTLAAGADPNSVHDDGNRGITALCVAIKAGRRDVASLLLKHGADPDVQIGDTPNALHLAAQRGMTGLCKRLIRQGMTVDAMCFSGTPLAIAADEGKLKTVRLLLEAGADVDMKNEVGFAPLHRAASGGHKVVCEELLDAGAEIDAKTKVGLTPLMLAARSDAALEVTKLLMGRGADVNATRDDGRDAMHEALTSQFNWATIRVLHVADGLERRTYGKEESTYLHAAAERGNYPGCYSLIKLEGKDAIHARDNNGNTPLHRSMQRARELVADVLIHKGADFQAKNNAGYSPLQILCGPDFAWGDDEENRVSILRELIKLGCDVNDRLDDGSTPLHLAAKNGFEKVCMVLMAHGADAMAKNDAGLTPASVAGRHQKKQVGNKIKDYAQSLAAMRVIDDVLAKSHKAGISSV